MESNNQMSAKESYMNDFNVKVFSNTGRTPQFLNSKSLWYRLWVLEISNQPTSSWTQTMVCYICNRLHRQ